MSNIKKGDIVRVTADDRYYYTDVGCEMKVEEVIGNSFRGPIVKAAPSRARSGDSDVGMEFIIELSTVELVRSWSPFEARFAGQKIYIVTRGEHQGKLCVSIDNDGLSPFKLADGTTTVLGSEQRCDTGDRVPEEVKPPVELKPGDVFELHGSTHVVTEMRDSGAFPIRFRRVVGGEDGYLSSIVSHRTFRKL